MKDKKIALKTYMFRKLLATICVLITFFKGIYAQESVELSLNWQYVAGYAYNMQKQPPWEDVDIPHSWNATDAKDGNIGYYRGLGVYRKQFEVTNFDSDKRYFLHFEGSTTITDVLVNGYHVGHHKGGSTGFNFEITNAINDRENELLVMVNNAYDSEVMPLVGDFNVYGGIHRPVHLIITNEVTFEKDNYGSPGIFITQKNVGNSNASMEIKGSVSNSSDKAKKIKITTSILDASGKEVASSFSEMKCFQRCQENWMQQIELSNPNLWNGRENPYLYKAVFSLQEGSQVLEKVEQPLGLRFFKLDADKGFFLNGEYLDLKGTCYHEAKLNQGSALTKTDIEEDLQIMLDMGVNAIRTSHYPQSETFYALCDSLGIILYTEIPQVGPGGYIGRGFMNSTGFKENGKQQLLEMMRQNYNHPSIVFWGLYNELKIQGDDPYEYINELILLLKRKTLIALLWQQHSKIITIMILPMPWGGTNTMVGTVGKPEEMGNWADEVHEEQPNRPISVSEYGAGASVLHHSDSLIAPKAAGSWHPEEWQAHYHEKNWEVLKTRPFIWGKFIWLMFDFGAAHRAEGDTNGLNDKGLVTADRKLKKDAYYFYKANWNPEPMLHLAEKRFSERVNPQIRIKAYTNLKYVDFYLNGKKIGSEKPENGIALSKEIILKKGENKIEIRGKSGKETLVDTVKWSFE